MDLLSEDFPLLRLKGCCGTLLGLTLRKGACQGCAVGAGHKFKQNTSNHTGAIPRSPACGPSRKLTELINERHENVKYMPGVQLGDNVVACADLTEAVRQAVGVGWQRPRSASGLLQWLAVAVMCVCTRPRIGARLGACAREGGPCIGVALGAAQTSQHMNAAGQSRAAPRHCHCPACYRPSHPHNPCFTYLPLLPDPPGPTETPPSWCSVRHTNSSTASPSSWPGTSARTPSPSPSSRHAALAPSRPAGRNTLGLGLRRAEQGHARFGVSGLGLPASPSAAHLPSCTNPFPPGPRAHRLVRRACECGLTGPS